MNPMKPGVVILSGGMDSATVLGAAHQSLGRDKVTAISINYGQRHVIELEAAARLAKFYQVEHHTIDLSGLKSILKGSSQTDPTVEVPHGHYEDETMKATVVPNRNMILLSIAAAAAIGRGWDTVYYGAHAGDHAIYPDCRPAFIASMGSVLQLCHYFPVTLAAPFSWFSKATIVKNGKQLGVPYELTYSCYEGRAKHCGKCGTCVERREAFIAAGVPDPTPYEE